MVLHGTHGRKDPEPEGYMIAFSGKKALGLHVIRVLITKWGGFQNFTYLLTLIERHFLRLCHTSIHRDI